MSEFKESKEIKDNKQANKEKITASLSPAKLNKPPQKWLKFGDDEEDPNSSSMAYKRTYSLDKREAAAMRRDGGVQIKPKTTEY